MEWQGLSSPSPGGLAADDESEREAPAGCSTGSPPVRSLFVAGVVFGCPGGLAVEAAATLVEAFSGTPGGLAVDVASEMSRGSSLRCTSPASLSVRAFLAAGAAPVAAVVDVSVLRALVGGPSSACLAVFLGLAAVCPPWRIIAALPRV